MKTYQIIILLLIGTLTWSACDKEDLVNVDEPNHRVVYTSQMDFQNRIQVNDTMSFGDVSAGVISRTWTFPENGVNVIDMTTNSSTNAIVKALFTQPGEFEVDLHQVYKDNAYVDNILKGKELDTTIVVKVLDSIKISVQANYLNEDGSLGAALTLEDMAENELEASKSVRYSLSTIGEPEDIAWSFEGGDPSNIENETEVDVKYRRMGTYNFQVVASRERPFGADTLSFTDFIKVIPSSDPVTLDAVIEEDGAIALHYSREMDPTSLRSGDFSVQIENSETILNPLVANVSIDQNQGNVVLLELENEAIYNDDTVTVSYTPGILSTLDGVAADAFEGEKVVFSGENVLSPTAYDYSFENSTASNWPYLGWGAPWDMYDFSISETQSQLGTKSGLVELRPYGGMIIGHRDDNGNNITFPIEADKTYEIGVWIYIEEMGTIDESVELPSLRFFWNPNTNWAVQGPSFDNSWPVGEWVYASTLAEFTAGGEYRFMIRGANTKQTEGIKFYMDNISVTEARIRP
ncbi:hypothetical protein SAMN04488033_10469 [Salegentibacter agarivorans]|uniref:PKD domain-containing protein n=1 Tax=Salegentibacter agarivorans TaxID=345907 RepID=A0A1I2KMU9_9FLAO|nr:hypothetical protein [Salegentibacter agarivorans]SFF68304.1 hypothetical protein SAMN04488033_10469 [Salegentibacter agarivorans]